MLIRLLLRCHHPVCHCGAENLQRDIESEKSSPDFVTLPSHYLEVAAILFEWYVAPCYAFQCNRFVSDHIPHYNLEYVILL